VKDLKKSEHTIKAGSHSWMIFLIIFLLEKNTCQVLVQVTTASEQIVKNKESTSRNEQTMYLGLDILSNTEGCNAPVRYIKQTRYSFFDIHRYPS
jgi:hypothetical protein